MASCSNLGMETAVDHLHRDREPLERGDRRFALMKDLC
jgi:hypothetical protein